MAHRVDGLLEAVDVMHLDRRRREPRGVFGTLRLPLDTSRRDFIVPATSEAPRARGVVSAHIGACAFCGICPVLVRLPMHVLFTELPKVSSDRLHLTDGETLEIAVDLQEFGLKVPTGRIERPRAPPRVRVKWMLVVTQVHRRQGDPLIGIEIPARPGQHVACPTREEGLIRSFPGDSLICPLDRGSSEHPRRCHCHGTMLAKRSLSRREFLL